MKILPNTRCLLLLYLSLWLPGCGTGLQTTRPDLVPVSSHLQSTIPVDPNSPSTILQLPILARPMGAVSLKQSSRLVIGEILGPCALEVKTALMRRLNDNPNYSVLTREYLQQLVAEKETHHMGDYDSRTRARVGELLGASQWVVGEVVSCDTTMSSDPTQPNQAQMNVMAALQDLDLSSGKVLTSSVSEGTHVPRKTSFLDFIVAQPESLQELVGDVQTYSDTLGDREASGASSSNAQSADSQQAGPNPAGEDNESLSDSGTAARPPGAAARAKEFLSKSKQILQSLKPGSRGSRMEGLVNGSTPGKSDKEKQKPLLRRDILSAAEDMASNFADKLFAREFWETVEMWNNPYRTYTESIRFVQLGRCDVAVAFMADFANQEIGSFTEREMAEYLHNYGVALLCNNKIPEANSKLQAAYRIISSESTLKMMGLSDRVLEWGLVIEAENEPEIKELTDRSLASFQLQVSKGSQ